MPEDSRFPFSFLGPLLEGFAPPEGAFDPAGAWMNRYRTHCLVGNVKASTGTFHIERTRAAGGALLRVRYERPAGARHVHRLSGELRCAADALSTPVECRLKSDAAGPRDSRLACDRVSRPAAAGPLSSEWSLFDAVQRLPRRPFPPLRFSLLTHDGQALPGHSLAYRGGVEVAVAGGSLPLHGYEHLGAGTLPWLYYVGESGRLLMAVSGLQAWLLDDRIPEARP